MQALIIVDVQNDFCPGGSLAVHQGDSVVPVINKLQERFSIVVATQDWHPPGHISFASAHGRKPGEIIRAGGIEQMLWPDHCVQNTPGAAFHPGLNTARITHVVRKGADPAVDSYSGFFDNRRARQTGLDAYLKRQGVEEVIITGLAADYCVRFTALDAVGLGYRTLVLADATRGVEARAGDVARALNEMRAAGVEVAQSADWLRTNPPA